MIPYGSLVTLVTPRGKRYVKKLEPGGDWHSKDGILQSCDIQQSDYGQTVRTSQGMPVLLEEATLEDRIMGIKRKTQIIYPKDIAFICLRLGAGPGRTIIEAGCGSGGLTVALSWFCGPTGKVVSHEEREEFAALARKNMQWAGVGENVEIFCRDIADGFCAKNADALFLDVREPWLYLKQAECAVKPGASLAFLLPTVNQVIQLCQALERSPFGAVEIAEIFIRQWKTVPDRLRPRDRMTAHTSFLIFCRQQVSCPEFKHYLPRGTRERKQDAARELREAESGAATWLV